MFVVLVLHVESGMWGIQMLPRTGYILAEHVTAALTYFADYRVIVPLLIVYFAGELVWQERDARLSENVDATPVPNWVLFLSKFVGLALVLGAFVLSLTAAGMLTQTLMGYHDFQVGLYLKILFGLQLPEYLLFAVLVLLVHALVDQKHVAMLVALVVYFLIVFSSVLGVEHKLLVYGSSPGWSFTDMRGFGSSVGPWLVFKVYWAAWALLLAVVATLLWVRGREVAFGRRIDMARLGFGRTAAAAAMAVALILTLGGFIFYNTNVINEYITDDELVERRADYERRYGKYEGIATGACWYESARRDLPRPQSSGHPRQLPTRESERGGDRLRASGAGVLCGDARDVRSRVPSDGRGRARTVTTSTRSRSRSSLVTR